MEGNGRVCAGPGCSRQMGRQADLYQAEFGYAYNPMRDGRAEVFAHFTRGEENEVNTVSLLIPMDSPLGVAAALIAVREGFKMKLRQILLGLVKDCTCQAACVLNDEEVFKKALGEAVS